MLLLDYQLLSDFINDADVLDLTESVVNQTIELRKQYKTKLPDAILAATALANGLVLISRNLSDFKNITGLEVIDPHNV
jgi:predicted nucleic acid-binding protein